MKTFAILILSLTLSLFCDSQIIDEKTLASRLDSAFRSMFNADEPGGSVFIQIGDKVLYRKSFGLADLKAREKFSDRTVANLGSISKTFVAYGILMLQNEGKLSVSDPLSRYFPEFKNKAIAEKITIAHLLTHTSGLPDSRNVAGDSIFYLTAKDYENFRPLTFTDTLEFEPGSMYHYSNPAYNGLALIIEKVTGRRWQDFIIRHIFKPSGMKHSKITDGSYPEKRVAHGYSYVNRQWTENDYGEFPTFPAAGNGGVWSSVRELRKYVKGINSCIFTDCKTIELSERLLTFPEWDMSDSLYHSLVWFVHPSFSYDFNKEEKCRVIEHSGSQGGFLAHLVMIPGYRMTIIWITNNGKNLTEEIRKILFSSGYIK